MRQIEIALGLLQQGDEFLLQHRNGGALIGAVGLIGCFGGKVNPSELPKHAVAREIGEETTFVSEPEQWELIGEVHVESDHKLEPVQIHATAYRLTIDDTLKVEAKEGALVRMTLEEIWRRNNELTPATKALFNDYYREK